MKKSNLAIIGFIFIYSFGSDLKDPPATVELYEVGKVSTMQAERDIAISPEGDELFYTIQAPRQGVFQALVCLKKDKHGNWGKPFVPSFSGSFSDLEPAYSPDGKKLFFCSNRPLSGVKVKDFDIWVVEKKDGVWGEPDNLGTVINTPGNEFYPSVGAGGNLYFTATYNNGVGREDIFRSDYRNGSYQPPVALDSAVNSKTYEFNACVSPKEDMIIFSSYGRKDDRGGGDLYVSKKNSQGNWLPAQNLALLNSDKIDYCPFLSFDGLSIFFTSERDSLKSVYADKRAGYEELVSRYNGVLNGKGNIYWISLAEVMKSLKF